MTKKFEVGMIYWSEKALWARDSTMSNPKVVHKKIYWRCVKRNPSTGFVSFERLYRNSDGMLRTLERVSRKIEKNWHDDCETITVGHGRNMWADRDYIMANREVSRIP